MLLSPQFVKPVRELFRCIVYRQLESGSSVSSCASQPILLVELDVGGYFHRTAPSIEMQVFPVLQSLTNTFICE